MLTSFADKVSSRCADLTTPECQARRPSRLGTHFRHDARASPSALAHVRWYKKEIIVNTTINSFFLVLYPFIVMRTVVTFSVCYLGDYVPFFRFLVRSKICHVYSLRNFGRQFVSRCVKEHSRGSCGRSWRPVGSGTCWRRREGGEGGLRRQEVIAWRSECTVFIPIPFLAKTLGSECQRIIYFSPQMFIFVEDCLFETLNNSGLHQKYKRGRIPGVEKILLFRPFVSSAQTPPAMAPEDGSGGLPILDRSVTLAPLPLFCN